MTTVSSEHATYRYEALDEEKKQVRLIKLEKSTSSTSLLRCKIDVFDLTSAPQYIALSYTWGPPELAHHILVEDEDFQVRNNLYQFLRAFHSFPSGLRECPGIEYLFIDQICIDQANMKERSSQVRFMAEIYTRSRHVLVWLGCDPEMLKAARHFKDNKFSGSAFEMLLSNPYFTRVWIVQEISLAKKLSFLCGDIELWWNDGAFGADKHDPFKSWDHCKTMEKLFKERYQKERRLDSVLKKYSVQKCQEPHDRVYGFLGLVPIAQRPLVDYSKSTQQVFLDVVAIVLEIYCSDISYDIYGNLMRYLRNLLELAWNMKFPDHDQRPLVQMFKQILEVEEDRVSGELETSLVEKISAFGYETADPNVVDGGQGLLIGRWWLEVNGKKHYHDCTSGTKPLLLHRAKRSLNDVYHTESWRTVEPEEASQRQLD